MFEYIRGTLAEASPHKAVVEVQGIGYGIHIPLSCYAQLPHTGKEILFYLSFHIREDAHKLYGFLSRAERDLFDLLTAISGIGPKTALSLIGHLDIVDLHAAITVADVRLLSKVPGVGKKTAERLIIEMRDKAPRDQPSVSSLGNDKNKVSDAVSALVNLGYNPLHAQRAVKKVLESAQEEPPLPELLRSALQQL